MAEATIKYDSATKPSVPVWLIYQGDTLIAQYDNKEDALRYLHKLQEQSKPKGEPDDQ